MYIGIVEQFLGNARERRTIAVIVVVVMAFMNSVFVFGVFTAQFFDRRCWKCIEIEFDFEFCPRREWPALCHGDDTRFKLFVVEFARRFIPSDDCFVIVFCSSQLER